MGPDFFGIQRSAQTTFFMWNFVLLVEFLKFHNINEWMLIVRNPWHFYVTNETG